MTCPLIFSEKKLGEGIGREVVIKSLDSYFSIQRNTYEISLQIYQLIVKSIFQNH